MDIQTRIVNRKYLELTYTDGSFKYTEFLSPTEFEDLLNTLEDIKEDIEYIRNEQDGG